MADFNLGFTQDQTRPVAKQITRSVTGLAETAMGDINKWRTVLTNNPSALPFKLPPSLQADIDRINDAIAFTGLKIPSTDIAETALKKALGDLVNPVLLDANKQIDGLQGKLKQQLQAIEQISWLG